MNVDLVLAPNPGPFTGPGTNTWVVSDNGEAVVVDPGPVISEHLTAIEVALRGLDPVAVIITHTHPDHAPAANGLAARLGVPAIGAAAGPDFSPDRLIADGDGVGFGRAEALCVATPGHTADSVCLRVGDALFSGDHIMGGSTVIVEDMSDYIASLHKLRNTGLNRIYPGHGPVIEDPDAVLTEYVAHRLERERQILGALERGATTIADIVEDVYADVDPGLHRAAALSVGAHLIKLRAEGLVSVGSDPRWDSEVELL